MATYAETLIACARRLGLADAEVARRLGVSRAQFANVKAGRDLLSPELAALIADLCGQDPMKAAARQMVANAREPRKSMLAKAFRLTPKASKPPPSQW